jgi:hypothetical protein
MGSSRDFSMTSGKPRSRTGHAATSDTLPLSLGSWFTSETLENGNLD